MKEEEFKKLHEKVWSSKAIARKWQVEKQSILDLLVNGFEVSAILVGSVLVVKEALAKQAIFEGLRNRGYKIVETEYVDVGITDPHIEWKVLKEDDAYILTIIWTYKFFTEVGRQIGRIVEMKNSAYGDSFAKTTDALNLYFPEGILPDQYDLAAYIVRTSDKFFRLVADNDPEGENPAMDIAGYSILQVAKKLEKE